MNAPDRPPLRLTQFSHGGGCGCKIAPGVLQQILAKAGAGARCRRSCWSASRPPTTPRSTSSTTRRRSSRPPISSCRSSTIRSTSARIAATNAISDVYAMGGTPLFALALVGMPVDKLPIETIRKILEGGEVGLRASAGIPIAGGHTIDSVEPIYGLVAIGLVDPKQRQAQRRRAARRRADPRQAARRGHLQRALKKETLVADGYAAMIASTTQLNTPGIALGAMAGVHALTDVTGFGLLGHLLEICRGSSVGATLDFARVPLLPGVLRARARRHRHRRLGPQLGGLRRRGRPRAAASATPSRRCSPIRRPPAACSSRARRRRWTTCLRCFAPKASIARPSSAVSSPVRRA